MKFLLKIRLSHYFFLFLAIFTLLVRYLPSRTFDAPSLTLFSVNSFLYGFYIAPILASQKARIDELQKIVRAEANALFTTMLLTRKLESETAERIKLLVRQYVGRVHKDKKPPKGEDEYEKLISELVGYKGKDEAVISKILDGVIANQQNRSNLAMQLNNKVFSNEWWIMSVLFSITLSFILLIKIGDSWLLWVVKALLCTGLSMLIAILVKLSTLTHKKAKELWAPIQKLEKSNFYRID